jgi:diguanylate cyclase (GGDEF)-like protein/PAS domain S-box-containing protein
VVTARDITEQKNIENALIASEKEFRLLAEAMPQIVWITRADGWSVYINQRWVSYTGVSFEESYGQGWIQSFHPDEQKQILDTWQNAIIHKVTCEMECQIRRADGAYRWWLVRGVPVLDEYGSVSKWFGTCTDIHDIKETEKALRDSESRLQFTLETSHIGCWDFNLVDYKSHRTLEHDRIFGYTSLLPEWSYPMFLNHILPEDRDEVNSRFKIAMENQSNWEFECRIHRADGELRWIWAVGKYLPNKKEGIPHMAGILQDITQRKKAEETIYDLAYYDPLTRLPNRRLMLDRLQHTLISRSLKKRHGAILFINLDNFRTLNDSKGHSVGDLLLIEVTQHLQEVVHKDDTVSRIGSDEFVLVLDGLNEATDLAALHAEAVAKRVLAKINQTFNLQNYEYRCSACIGITLFCGNELSVDELIKHADIAMHQAKQNGSNSICFFDSTVQATLEYRVQLEAWMHKALHEQYQLYYQVQVNELGKATGAESLIRWHHPEHGLISPAAFIPLAEETGLILPIGQWVLETACAQLKAWEDNPHTQNLVIAVNVSAKQFGQQSFVEQVLDILKASGANPNRLKLELTESMLVNNVDDIIEKMNALKNKGVKFSLDDFGTGFSSLTYLKSLPLTQLKIDQSFVRDALTNSNDAAIIRTIIALGDSLEMEVIAEGVETEQQREFLAAHGCHNYQGYLFSKPLPVKEFEQLLRKLE